MRVCSRQNPKLHRGLAVAAFLAAASGCGYRALEAHGSREGFHVALVKAGPVRSETRREVELGIREALLEEGALLSGTGFPVIEYELIDALDEPAAIAAVAGKPSAGGVRVLVRGRAWVRRQAGGAAERETGDLRGEGVVGASQSLLGAGAELRGAELAAARNLGRDLARAALGMPVVPTVD